MFFYRISLCKNKSKTKINLLCFWEIIFYLVLFFRFGIGYKAEEVWCRMTVLLQRDWWGKDWTYFFPLLLLLFLTTIDKRCLSSYNKDHNNIYNKTFLWWDMFNQLCISIIHNYVIKDINWSDLNVSQGTMKKYLEPK